jgi:lipopolysaccharide export system ATP-binding protein
MKITRIDAPTPASATGQDAAPVGQGLFADSLCKSFRGRKVVGNVSLKLARGEVAGLLGPNGAGKTTCFYMITGLIAVDSGAIYLDG